MSKGRRKSNAGARKSALRPLRRRKARFITRAEARRRAERYVPKRMFKGATVRESTPERLGIYVRASWTEREVWVVYKNSDESAFESSQVILECKRTGRVFYEGRAQDEG